MVSGIKAIAVAQASADPIGEFCVLTLGDSPPPTIQDITAIGFPSASSTFNTDFQVGQAVDDATNTNWFSNGSTGGDAEVFDWTIANGSNTVLTRIETDPGVHGWIWV